MAKEVVSTYVSTYRDYVRSSIQSEVEQFNNQCLPLLKELGIFKERDINAYEYLNDNNYAGLYSAYLAKCLADAPSDHERELVRVTFSELWRKFCETHFFPTFPHVGGKECIHYDESAEKFVFDFDAYKITEEIIAESPAELATAAKLRALDKALADINFTGVSTRILFYPDEKGKISVLSNLGPESFSQLVKSNK